MSLPSTRARRLKTPSITRSPRLMRSAVRAPHHGSLERWHRRRLQLRDFELVLHESQFAENDGELVVELRLLVQGVDTLVEPAQRHDVRAAEGDEIFLEGVEWCCLDVVVDGGLNDAAPRSDP